MRIKLLSSLLAFGFLAAAAPALAASQGEASSIGLQDLNHDGKIDRAVVSIANPQHAAWTVRGSKGIGVTYQGQPLAIGSAFVTASEDPATLEIVFADDGHLPATTSAEGFELTYAPQGAAAGVSDGTVELQAIAAGDTGPSDTELDQAAPVLLSSSPAEGTIDADRDAALKLTFSEPVRSDTAIPSSSQNPDAWGFTADGADLTVTHAPYGRGALETFGIDVQDAAGNHAAAGSYPNPFSFRTGTANTPTPTSDTVFELTAPKSLQTLQAGAPTVVAWHTNEAGVTSVRFGFSSDGGTSYTTIATRYVADGPYVWYPPAVPGAIQLKAEALNAAGAVVNIAFVNTVTVTGASVAPVRVLAGPDVAWLTPTVAKVTLWTDRAPEKADVSCGGLPATVTLTGDRPVRLEAAAEGLTGAPITCRFVLSDAGSQAVTVETSPIAMQAPVPQGEGFIGLKEGDLFKSADGAAVYWYKDGKRWVFPDATVYRSWFGDDFSKVLTVPSAELASILIGGDVRMKEGVFLLKIQSDPKTYAVEPNGRLRWIQTEDQAQALYGLDWAKRVRDIDVSLFVDYAVGSPLQGDERPAGFAG